MASQNRETQWIQSAKEGDREALQKLIELYHPRLMATYSKKLPSSLRSEISAEDVLQEVYIAAVRHIRKYKQEDGAGFYAWLSTIAKNRLLDLIKAKMRDKRGGKQRHDGSLEDLLGTLSSDSRSPSRGAAREEALIALEKELRLLPPDNQKAIRLRYLEGQSAIQVGKSMGKTSGAIHLLCHRGLAKLRKAMKKYISDSE